MQAQVEELTGHAGLQILRAILENEVTRRVGPPHRPNPTAGCVRWGKQPGYVVFAGQKIPLQRPRVRTREGQEVELASYGQLQQDGKLQRAVRERMVAGLSTRNYRRAVESVVEGYGIEKSSVSRQFVAASCNQLRVLCERRLEDLNLVVLMIDGIHFGGQVLVVALGIAESGEKHVLGVWPGATENTTVVKGLLEDLVDRGLDQLAYPRANARDFGKSIPEPYRDRRPVVHCFRLIEIGFPEVSGARFLLPIEPGMQSDVHELWRRTTPRPDSPNAAVCAREL